MNACCRWWWWWWCGRRWYQSCGLVVVVVGDAVLKLCMGFGVSGTFWEWCCGTEENGFCVLVPLSLVAVRAVTVVVLAVAYEYSLF